jgi:integrase
VKPTGGNHFTKYQAREEGLSQSSLAKPTGGNRDSVHRLRKMLEKVLDVPANTIGKREAERFADVCAKTLQPTTSKARIWLLVKCWDWAKGKYHVAEENPFRGLATRFKFKSQERKPPQPFSALEVRAILDCFRSSVYYKSYTDFVAFLFGVGCRIGEAVGLRWENVAADFSSVYICESISRGVVGSTKTRKSRDVNLSPSIAAGENYLNVAKAAGHSPRTMLNHYLNNVENRSVFVDFD